MVAAAADLARTQNSLSESFAKIKGYRIRFSFGSSGMLARQIANGAPFDVFLSANESFIRDLAAAGKIVPESVQVYAEGRLGLWSRGGRVQRLEDLGSPGVRHVAIANPTHAPYGLAAREALQRMHLWDKLAGRMVYGENVQSALQYAETGNADAAVVAWSLVFDRGGILLPADLHSPIRQFGGVVAGSRARDRASAFLKFLSSPAGKQVLRQWGFN
jgi:molybdate transport system substrate-binding protein